MNTNEVRTPEQIVKDTRLEKLELMESSVERLCSALRYAKVLARMESQGKTPDKSTLLEKVDLSIDEWNVVINLVPRELKAVKLSLL